jgi:hypothetical protein
MPRRKSPAFDPRRVDPWRVVVLGDLREYDGKLEATLELPRVPVEMVEEVGRACAMAIMAVMKWPEDKAAIVAQRVCEELADHIKQVTSTMTPEHRAAVKQLLSEPREDLDDDIPF